MCATPTFLWPPDPLIITQEIIIVCPVMCMPSSFPHSLKLLSRFSLASEFSTAAMFHHRIRGTGQGQISGSSNLHREGFQPLLKHRSDLHHGSSGTWRGEGMRGEGGERAEGGGMRSEGDSSSCVTCVKACEQVREKERRSGAQASSE